VYTDFILFDVALLPLRYKGLNFVPCVVLAHLLIKMSKHVLFGTDVLLAHVIFIVTRMFCRLFY